MARSNWLTLVSLTALAAVTLLPLLEPPPVAFLAPRAVLLQWLTKLLVIGVLLAVIAGRWLLDQQFDSKRWTLTLLLAAGAMTACHWFMVDRLPLAAEWQRTLYLPLLNHEAGPPHQYRLLPYGFVRLLEWITHDWLFSCLGYRWFFNYWLLWAWYRFACLFHEPRRAALTLLPFVVLYPFSVAYYLGQLTDPLSHTLFVLGFVYLLDKRPFALAVALALGVLAKETAVLLIPCWFACYWRTGWRDSLTTGLLGVTAGAAFLAARLPLGWQPGAKQMNEVGFMIGTNLGIGPPSALTSVPLAMNYLLPLLFVVPFLPWVLRNWRTSERRLRILALTLTPLLLLSNLCFGWLYEARNYVPLLPLLSVLALPVKAAESGDPDAVTVGAF